MSGRVQEGPRSPPDTLTNYLFSGEIHLNKKMFVLPIVLPIGYWLLLDLFIPLGITRAY